MRYMLHDTGSRRACTGFATSLTALVVVSICIGASVATAAEPRKLQPLDAFELEYATDVQISPDGEHVLYVRNAADVMTDERTARIWLLSTDGERAHPIDTSGGTGRLPRWSPAGDRFAYVSDAENGSQIRVRWLSSHDEATVAQPPYPPSDMAWSPDGQSIAFIGFEAGEPPRFTELPRSPANATWKEPAYVTDKLLYRFNGVGLFPPGSTHVFVAPADGGTTRRITPDGFDYGNGATTGGGLAWTKDGKELIVSVNRRDDAERHPLDTELYAYSLEGTRVRKITDRVGPDDSPRVSPDGSTIAYTGFDDRSQGYQTTMLYITPVGGGGSKAVAEQIDRSILDHHWAPDGKGVYVTYDDEGVTTIAYVSLEGDHRVLNRQLGGGFGLTAYGGALGSGPFSIANDGRYAVVYADSDTPGDVAIPMGPNRRLHRLTNLNADFTRDLNLGQVETIRYSSSFDDKPIQGWLVLPPNFDPQKKYPLILEIHGGPFAAYGPRFDLEKQLMAANGYVVLYTNPRGSTSYGEAFANSIHHQYPGHDYDDLMSGVDAVIDRGFIDPERLFVTGGSGGGILTAWIIGKTDRFKASAVHYPVIDWETFSLTSDVSTYVLKHWFPEMPWANPAHYRDRSPLSLIESVTTPTLVVCGDADLRTPISQAEMYYTSLKLNDVEAAFVRIPDEPHGAAVHPSHQLQKVLNTIGWFNQYGGASTP